MDDRSRTPGIVDQQAQADGNVAGRRGAWLVLVVKAAAAVAIIWWLCTDRLDLGRLARVSLTFDLGVLIVLVFASMALPALRWWWLLRIQQISVSRWRVATLTWIGYATSLILPGAASSDLAKSYMIVRQEPQARARSLSTVLVDRIIGVYSLVFLGCASGGWFIVSRHAPPLVWNAWCVLSAMLAGSTLFALAWIRLVPSRHLLAGIFPLAWVEAWRESYRLYDRSKWAIAGCFVLSLISNTFVAASLAAADRVFGGTVGWTASLVVGPVIVLANCLPFTPGGIGVAEAVASEMYSQVGSSNGAEMMLAIRLVMATLSLPALMIVFRRNQDSTSRSPSRGTATAREVSIAEKPFRKRRAA